jgi:hypothetical protein
LHSAVRKFGLSSNFVELVPACSRLETRASTPNAGAKNVVEGQSLSELSAITETIPVLLMHHLNDVYKAVQRAVPRTGFRRLKKGMTWVIGVENDASLKTYLKYAFHFSYCKYSHSDCSLSQMNHEIEDPVDHFADMQNQVSN